MTLGHDIPSFCKGRNLISSNKLLSSFKRRRAMTESSVRGGYNSLYYARISLVTHCTPISFKRAPPISSMKINNLKPLKEKRKALRNNSTSAEVTLWRYLKGSQLGKKFRRQHSVGPYILDFYCATEKLAVELDGHYHFTDEGIKHDQIRDAYLKKFGIRVVRFENVEIFEDTALVLEKIREELLPPQSLPAVGTSST
ncbi:MAG TPA: DUF559 domain-containing protein [Cyclobacteriaceae bacterium]|nr:DUF559 domain-containing protein [Cyclobacteriaceae bacterium]